MHIDWPKTRFYSEGYEAFHPKRRLLMKLPKPGGTPPDGWPLPFVDAVDRVRGQERDLIIASYAVSDRDFVRDEGGFVVDPRRFNVTFTGPRSGSFCWSVML